MSLSHFDEKSGVVNCQTPWGRWWQNVQEVHVEIDLPPGTRSKDLKIKIEPTFIECSRGNGTILKGELFSVVHSPPTSVWTLEENRLLHILLSKATYSGKEFVWEALLKDGTYAPDLLTLNEMRKKIDLEKFQMEVSTVIFIL
ncbi:hypothetical protein AAG570_008317 [Ranatra chinensis]|uniref:CS domain-containing protein n=1 Tax=Ranatra chinensis TaxID=642074 RepID=A0ABD0YGP4_9HEMI